MDSLYVKFVAVTWEFHIAAMIVVVDLQRVFYILYLYLFILYVSATFFFLIRETLLGPGLFNVETYRSH
jgi:hypothetical protein